GLVRGAVDAAVDVGDGIDPGGKHVFEGIPGRGMGAEDHAQQGRVGPQVKHGVDDAEIGAAGAGHGAHKVGALKPGDTVDQGGSIVLGETGDVLGIEIHGGDSGAGSCHYRTPPGTVY